MSFRMKTFADAVYRTGFALLVAALLAGTPTPAQADKGDCSQPASTGPDVAASDCLFILRVAVGSTTCTPACICAPLGSLPTKTSDALLCLRKSVGQAVTLNCPCDLPDGDDFNDNAKDTDLWGTDIVYFGSGTLVETSQRLEFRSTGATGTHYTARPWIASVVPYNQDWEVSLDTTNLTEPSANDEINSYGISIYDEDNTQSEIFVEMYSSHYDAPPARNGYYSAISDTDGDLVDFVDNFATDQTSTHGAIRIAFDSTDKVFTMYYDADRTNGYQWSELGSFSVDNTGGGDANTNWGMTSGDRFIIDVYGYTEEMPIAAGEMYGDNFLISGGIAP